MLPASARGPASDTLGSSDFGTYRKSSPLRVSLLHQSDRRTEATKRAREAEAEVVAFVVCEAIGLNVQDSAGYIQLLSGDEAALVESLDHVERSTAAFLSAITSRKFTSHATVNRQ